jgi:hypothetical protein
VQVTFKPGKGGKSPVLYDLSLYKNKPPVCTGAVASPSTIASANANNTFLPVVVEGVTDPDGDTIKIKVTSTPVWTQVANDKKCPDANIINGKAQIRAERTADTTVKGRVYYINFKADDSKGGTCTGQVKVCVRLGSFSCGSGGAGYNSLTPTTC